MLTCYNGFHGFSWILIWIHCIYRSAMVTPFPIEGTSQKRCPQRNEYDLCKTARWHSFARTLPCFWIDQSAVRICTNGHPLFILGISWNPFQRCSKYFYVQTEDCRMAREPHLQQIFLRHFGAEVAMDVAYQRGVWRSNLRVKVLSI